MLLLYLPLIYLSNDTDIILGKSSKSNELQKTVQELQISIELYVKQMELSNISRFNHTRILDNIKENIQKKVQLIESLPGVITLVNEINTIYKRILNNETYINTLILDEHLRLANNKLTILNDDLEKLLQPIKETMLELEKLKESEYLIENKIKDYDQTIAIIKSRINQKQEALNLIKNKLKNFESKDDDA